MESSCVDFSLENLKKQFKAIKFSHFALPRSEDEIIERVKNNSKLMNELYYIIACFMLLGISFSTHLALGCTCLVVLIIVTAVVMRMTEKNMEGLYEMFLSVFCLPYICSPVQFIVTLFLDDVTPVLYLLIMNSSVLLIYVHVIFFVPYVQSQKEKQSESKETKVEVESE